MSLLRKGLAEWSSECGGPAGGLEYRSGHSGGRGLQPIPPVVTFVVSKIRRGGFIFVTWKGDHSPRHVHVYRDGKLVLKWNLDARLQMVGKPTARILSIIAALEKEGLL